MIKWPITDYYAKKLPNGQAFPATNRKNPGSGEYVPDRDKGLQRLADDHGEEMVPLQIVAVFILRHIHLLTFPTFVVGLILTKHHGVPVADDCNGADIPVSSSEGELVLLSFTNNSKRKTKYMCSECWDMSDAGEGKEIWLCHTQLGRSCFAKHMDSSHDM